MDPQDIKELRKRLHLTQEDLASELEVSVQAVRSYESGTRSPRKRVYDMLLIIGRLAEAIGVLRDYELWGEAQDRQLECLLAQRRDRQFESLSAARSNIYLAAFQIAGYYIYEPFPHPLSPLIEALYILEERTAISATPTAYVRFPRVEAQLVQDEDKTRQSSPPFKWFRRFDCPFCNEIHLTPATILEDPEEGCGLGYVVPECQRKILNERGVVLVEPRKRKGTSS